MRNPACALACALTLFPLSWTAQQPPAADAIVPTQTVPLFNGKDLTGWSADVPEKDKNPDAPASFVVRDGMLVSLGVPRGHLLTDMSSAGGGDRGRVPQGRDRPLAAIGEVDISGQAEAPRIQ